MSPYQAVGGVSESYLANGNISVHMTPPTRDYSSKPHPTTENSGARRSVQPPFRTGTCSATSTVAACVIVVGFDTFLGSNPTPPIYNASRLHLIWLKSGMKFCVTKLYHFFRKILSSSSSTPTKPVIPSPARRVRITEPEPSSYHDDYISRLESLQQRLSGMESGECDSGIRSRD